MTITVYSKPACGQCLATTRTLDSKGITYNYVDITKDPEAYAYVTSLGHMSAPVVVTDEDHWSGFKVDKINELANVLKAA